MMAIKDIRTYPTNLKKYNRRKKMAGRFESLSDEEWDQIKQLFPAPQDVVEAVLMLLSES